MQVCRPAATPDVQNSRRPELKTEPHGREDQKIAQHERLRGQGELLFLIPALRRPALSRRSAKVWEEANMA